jgi:hypothetical protein
MTVDQHEAQEQHIHRLMGASWADSGEYGLSPAAASVFWYLHAHGVWEASLAGGRPAQSAGVCRLQGDQG